MKKETYILHRSFSNFDGQILQMAQEFHISVPKDIAHREINRSVRNHKERELSIIMKKDFMEKPETKTESEKLAKRVNRGMDAAGIFMATVLLIFFGMAIFVVGSVLTS